MVAAEPDTTKQKLVAAARDILLERGLSGLSMRRVAQSCGVSATAIYRHFDDKDELVAQAVLEGFRIFASYLMDGLEASTPLLRFRALGRRYFDFARQHSQYYRLIFMIDCQQLGMNNLDEVSKREVSGTFQLLQDRVAECQREGVFRDGDPRALAASVWASVHGLSSLILTQNLGGSEAETEALIELHLCHIEAGLAR